MRKSIETLIEETRNSSFNRHNYYVTLRLHRFVEGCLMYTHSELDREDKSMSHEQWIKDVVPEFQRDNNKWTHDMQVKFIENLLSGVKCEIYFFRVEKDMGWDYQIIDGLQRTTAILDFFAGKVKPFGYSYEELEENEDLMKFRTDFGIRTYDFDTWGEVGKFYIDMNQYITHSEEDIDIAKKWFKEAKGIEL